MLYLSQIINRPIIDVEGEKVATIKDVVVRYGEDDYPPVIGVVARYGRRNFFMSQKSISDFGGFGVKLNSDILNLRPF
ncbi:MAG: PRC-barrel domain-containing protein [Pyrinomonadaceae bacterium]|nr:PRC-barrel domain-containing protein [Pyrinomonadaceae bacterium]